MDTKEKKPVRKTGNRPAAGGRPGSVRQQRRRRPTDNRKPAGEKKPRVVRPPREDIPEVVYTMPKPFRKGTFLLKLLSVGAVVLAMVMALSIFFRVKTVTVAGMEKYTPWMVREASGIEEGDSLLGLNRAKAAGRIIAKLPYIDNVKIGINLPGTVNIEITELKVTYAVQAVDSSWWLITSEGRVVEPIDTTEATGYTRITGVMIEVPEVDQTVDAAQTPEQTQPETEETEQSQQTEATSETEPSATEATEATAAPTSAGASANDTERLNVALDMIQRLEQNEVFGQVASVDVSDVSKLTLQYGKRFHVILGSSDQLDYKISYMAQAVKQIPGNDMGELDVSFEFSDEALFTPA